MTTQDAKGPEFKEYKILKLDNDEAGHLKQVSQEIAKWCALANGGVMLTAGCVTWAPTLEKTETSSPDLIKALLTVKCANLIRLSATAILIGYYTGAAVLLRAAFESLAYVHLFDDDPDEIGLWLKLKLHPDLHPRETDESRRSQFYRAKESFIRRAPMRSVSGN